jgi:hypothetical protein
VSPAADGKLNPSLARHRDKTGDIARIRNADNCRGVTVNSAIEYCARLFISRVIRGDYPSVEERTQL